MTRDIKLSIGACWKLLVIFVARNVELFFFRMCFQVISSVSPNHQFFGIFHSRMSSFPYDHHKKRSIRDSAKCESSIKHFPFSSHYEHLTWTKFGFIFDLIGLLDYLHKLNFLIAKAKWIKRCLAMLFGCSPLIPQLRNLFWFLDRSLRARQTSQSTP